MTDHSSTTDDPILQQLFQAVSPLQQDIAEIKKKDTAKEKDDTTQEDDARNGGNDDTTVTKQSRKQPCNGGPSAISRETIACDGEDDLPQEASSHEGSW